MKTYRVFVTALISAAGIAFAAGFLNATLPLAGERPLSPEGTVVLVGDACRLTGAVALTTDDVVVAEFAVTNTGGAPATAEFHYSVEKTEAMSPFSRMMPVARQVKQGHCMLTVAPGGEQVERIVVEPAGAVSNAFAAGLNGERTWLWTLKVSRTAISNTAGWGGLPPGIASATGQLTDAVLILAAPKPVEPTPGLSVDGSWTPGLVTTGAPALLK